MIAILTCTGDAKESMWIQRDCRERIARRSDERITQEHVSDDNGLSEAVQANQLVHLLYYSFTHGQSCGTLRWFRRQNADAMMMLITDMNVSPLEYLRPGVAPDALLLRPLSREQLDASNGEFIDSFLERKREKKTDDSFVIDTREEKVWVPYSAIYYFEARNKKMYLRTRDEEFVFYHTLDQLENELPGYFRRCHRSYLVNTKKIRRIISSEHCIELQDQIGVPVSRSYQAAFRELTR